MKGGRAHGWTSRAIIFSFGVDGRRENLDVFNRRFRSHIRDCRLVLSTFSGDCSSLQVHVSLSQCTFSRGYGRRKESAWIAGFCFIVNYEMGRKDEGGHT